MEAFTNCKVQYSLQVSTHGLAFFPSSHLLRLYTRLHTLLCGLPSFTTYLHIPKRYSASLSFMYSTKMHILSILSLAFVTGTVIAAPHNPSATTPRDIAATGYMAVVDKWRQQLGLTKLTFDSKLEANALKTVKDGNGQMKHELNPGTFAQVLAPGGTSDSDFENCFVGGWLCERPDLPGLNGICDTAGKGWIHTSTGHADILTSPSYSKIGCANAVGIWGCDLA